MHIPRDDLVLSLAQLCKNKFSESFPEIDCAIYYPDSGYPDVCKVGVRVQRASPYNPIRSSSAPRWLLIIHFFEARVMISSKILVNNDQKYAIGHEILYSDPKLMDKLLSELKTRVTTEW